MLFGITRRYQQPHFPNKYRNPHILRFPSRSHEKQNQGGIRDVCLKKKKKGKASIIQCVCFLQNFHDRTSQTLYPMGALCPHPNYGPSCRPYLLSIDGTQTHPLDSSSVYTYVKWQRAWRYYVWGDPPVNFKLLKSPPPTVNTRISSLKALVNLPKGGSPFKQGNLSR